MPETCAHFTNPNRDTGGKVGFWGRWKTSSTKSGGFICELPPTQATADIRILVFFFLKRRNHTDLLGGLERFPCFASLTTEAVCCVSEKNMVRWW